MIWWYEYNLDTVLTMLGNGSGSGIGSMLLDSSGTLLFSESTYIINSEQGIMWHWSVPSLCESAFCDFSQHFCFRKACYTGCIGNPARYVLSLITLNTTLPWQVCLSQRKSRQCHPPCSSRRTHLNLMPSWQSRPRSSPPSSSCRTKFGGVAACEENY